MPIASLLQKKDEDFFQRKRKIRTCIQIPNAYIESARSQSIDEARQKCFGALEFHQGVHHTAGRQRSDPRTSIDFREDSCLSALTTTAPLLMGCSEQPFQ